MVTEQTIRELINSTTKELNTIGYYPHSIKNIAFVNAASFYAMVYPTQNLLKFSNYFKEAPIEQIEATIMHEMCHMVPESGRGHGAEWKFIAAKVNKTYSKYSICRVGSQSTVSPEDWPLRKVALISRHKNAVQLKCTGCGHIYYVSKGSRADRFYSECYCSRCHGTLVRAE